MIDEEKRMKKGKVYLIGAGPGDPELFTLKGKRCLEKADVIVGDYLADKRILRFANKKCGIHLCRKKLRQPYNDTAGYQPPSC